MVRLLTIPGQKDVMPLGLDVESYASLRGVAN